MSATPQSPILAEPALVPAPQEWAPLFPEDLVVRRRLACLDATVTEDGVRLWMPRHVNPRLFLDEAELSRDGVVIPMPEPGPLPGGFTLDVPEPGPVTLTFNGGSCTVSPRTPVAPFAGLRVLLATLDRASPEQVGDWASFHARHQGAETVCLIHRLHPDHDHDISAHLAAIEEVGLPVAVLRLREPTGMAGRPARQSHAYAPDGPGRAQREYAVDLWHAPLDEIALLELAHRTVLTGALSVLFCEIADLVAPTTPTVFERAEQSDSYLKIRGRHAYPWRLDDPEGPAAHADHGCVSFDGEGTAAIWCVAPGGPLSEAQWRPFRISTIPPDPVSEELSFWRCMAVLHPGEPAAALAPKSSLVPAPELATLIESTFSTTPETAPAPEAKPVPPVDPANRRVLIVTCMKNEGPFILEWLAWHRAIGVTDFLIYTNDCTDGTDTLLDLLATKGLVEHRQNPFRETGEKPQHAALHEAEGLPITSDVDWIVSMDVDEFIHIHTGDGHLDDLFATVPDATMISMTWRLFGNADVAPFENRFITEQFTRCAPEYIRKPHQAWGFKTLFRPLGHYKKFGVHRPKGLKPECLPQITWVNGSGQTMPEKMLRSGWRSSTSNWGYGLVTLNHYAVRSAESYLVKRDRGRVNHVNRDQGLAYWFRMNNNAVEDTRILGRLGPARAEFARLMSDPEIAAQHGACVAAHRARIAELMQRPDYRALYDEITGDRLRKLSRLHALFGTRTFLDGPDSIPPGTENLPPPPLAAPAQS